MIWDGIKLQKASHRYGWRFADPTRDVDADGRPLGRHEVAIVRMSRCRIYEENGRRYYDASEADAIPLTYFGTNYGVGREIEKTADKPGILFHIAGVGDAHFDRYWVSSYYLVHDGIVYRGYVYTVEYDGKRHYAHRVYT